MTTKIPQLHRNVSIRQPERFQFIIRGYGIKISEHQDGSDKIGPRASMKWLNLTRPAPESLVPIGRIECACDLVAQYYRQTRLQEIGGVLFGFQSGVYCNLKISISQYVSQQQQLDLVELCAIRIRDIGNQGRLNLMLIKGNTIYLRIFKNVHIQPLILQRKIR